MNIRQLEGHVALVTGGSRGIGRAISQALAQEGANSGSQPARHFPDEQGSLQDDA